MKYDQKGRRRRRAGNKIFGRMRREFHYLKAERLMYVCNLLLCRAC